MRISKGTLFLIRFIIFFLAVIVTFPIHAQSPTQSSIKSQEIVAPVAPAGPLNIALSPTFVNLYTDPGKEVSSQFSITNNNAFTEYFKLNLIRYQVTQGGSGITIVPLEKNEPFARWIKFESDSFSVDPNQKKTIRFTIAPAKDATLGYYYGVMINRVREDLPKDQTSLTAVPAFSILLEVNTPNAKRELQFVDFSTDRLFYEYLPVTFNVTVKNTGSIHIVPKGNVFVDWGSQKDVGILIANQGQGNVLPHATRTFNTVWEDGFAVRVPKMENGFALKDKEGNIQYTTKYDFTKFHKFRIGKYTAHLLMVYDNGQRDVPLEARISFWVIPWKILLILFVTLAFAIVGIRSTIASFIRRVR